MDEPEPTRSNAKGYANDDHISFNTQCSTQWDGFKHYPYQNYPEQGQHVYAEPSRSLR